MSTTSLIRTIAGMPEFSGRLGTGALRNMVIRDNTSGFYHSRGQAPLSVMINGPQLAPFLGVSQPPLYYTMTASGQVHTGNVNCIRLATDLAKDMGFKNPLAEVCLDGGKSVLYLSKGGYFAVTCVYGDPDLFQRGDVIAKGGVRIMAEAGLDETAILNMIEPTISQYLRAFVDLGTLGFSRSEGPDMKPACLDEGALMGLMDRIGRQAEDDLGVQLVPFTTSGPGELGFFNHDEWRGTSYGHLECLCALLSNASVLSHFGIDRSNPITMNIQGYGEVGSNIVRLLREVERYSGYGFAVSGISDESGAFYNPSGFSLDLLYDIAQERERGWGINASTPFTLAASSHYRTIAPHQIERDALIFMPAVVSIAAGPPYVIRDTKDVSRLQTRIWAPVANAPLGTKTSAREEIRQIETAMQDRRIINLPAWMLNFGGIALSKEEILHRLMAGGIHNMTDPLTRAWLKEHVNEGDVSDTAWANMGWALHEWAKIGYSAPLSDIMEGRIASIQKRRTGILMGWDRSDSLPGNLMRMDSATMRAKMEVMAKDFSSEELEDMRRLLTDWNAPEEERRVAADVLGKLCSKGCQNDLLAIIERGLTADLQASAQSTVMFRNAATGLGYILEGRAATHGDILNRLKEVLGVLKSQNTEEAFGKIVALEWLLDKLGS